MILVDTSVWIDHLRSTDKTMDRLLELGEVICHPFIVGEIAVGSLKQRSFILRNLSLLPQINVAHNAEVMHLIAEREIFGRGIGYIDAHLLAALQLTPDTALWTRDKRLQQVALTLDIRVAQ